MASGQTDPIYLDYNGTTPIDPRVAQQMLPYLHEHFGNPSSGHEYGRRARRALQEARDRLASLLGCASDEVVFTSGGTESNNMVLFGAARALKERGRHLITSRIEHPAVIEPCRALEKEGYEITWVPVRPDGCVDPDAIERAFRDDTILVSIMHANNETGALQPVADIAAQARRRGVLIHTDAAQSVGKIPTRVDALGVDLLTVAGHKLYAPKGIGALYVRRGTPVERFMFGAGQERGLRPGTENVLAIVGLGAAAELALEQLEEERTRLAGLRDTFQQRLSARVPGAVIHAGKVARLPNTLSIGFPGMMADRLLAEIEGVAASAGAACHSDAVKVSHVLEAMQVPRDVALGTLRFSLGRFTTPDELERAAAQIEQAVQRLSS